MISIGIDGNEANVKEGVGVSIYTLNLLNYFKNISDKDLVFNVYLKNYNLEFLPKESPSFKYRFVRPKALWSQFSLPINLITENKNHVFFSPAHYAPRFCPIPLVVTLHDLSYYYYPDEFLKKDLYKLLNWTKYSVQKAKKIIAVSQSTKKDIIKFLKVPENKIKVIYNGFEKKKKNTSIKNKININKPYILYVGTLQPRKNLITLVAAFNEFKKKYPEYKLVIVGKKGWLYEDIFKTVKSFKLEKEVIFTGYVNSNVLIRLYQNAFCFVLPSFYEGFGIPILEAMSYSCPVICSNTSSLPEIAGDAALLFNPNNYSELLKQLLILKTNTNLRVKLIDKGLKRTKNFSWQKCAKETLDILIEAAKES